MPTTTHTTYLAPARTPWGPAQDRLPRPVAGSRAPITVVHTASHGGVYVPPALLPRMPAAHRAYARLWSGSERWFEEDVAAIAVILAFPESFPEVSAACRASMRGDLDAAMARHGLPATPGV